MMGMRSRAERKSVNERATIPFHLVSGFLGAGKTTIINRLLRAPELSDALIIVNEWGEVGIDHLLYERLAGEAVLLNSGCVCCALRGDLVDCLHDLLDRRERGAMPQFSRIVLETTGLAEPAPILYALLAEPTLAARLNLSGVTTLIDAVNGLATLRLRPENARQIALADRLVVTKSDLLAPTARVETLAELREGLRALNPVAPILDGAAGEFGARDFLSAAGAPSFSAPPPPSVHSSSVRAYAFRTEEKIEPRALAQFLALLGGLLGPRLLRLKGVVGLADRPEEPMLIEGAQHVFHAPRALARWPDDDRTTRLVIIVDGLPERRINDLWSALTRAPQVDAPDLEALTDNPLAPRVRGLMG
jgi:G3E family GTPase